MWKDLNFAGKVFFPQRKFMEFPKREYTKANGFTLDSEMRRSHISY